jgi:hypothetical protein
MQPVTDDVPQPQLDHLSSLAALVLLAYGLVRIISLPTLSAEVVLMGLVIPLTVNTRLIMLTLAAALSVVGADWLVRSHPRSAFDGPPVRHWIIPGLAALGIGGLLTRLPQGVYLWLGLASGAGLLLAVFIGEFVVVEPDDPRYPTAAFGLRNLAYILLLGSFFVLRATEMRAIFAIPLILLAGAAVSWRLLSFDRPDLGPWPYPVAVGWIGAQIALGLHYWPISPLRDALILVLVIYLANSFLSLPHTATDLRRRVIELLVVAGAGLSAIMILA